MPDAHDMELLRQFARDQSETAFTELVRRHLNLVHSVARRCTGHDGDAHDVAQAVFIILARKADSLGGKTNLSGWLYETTRFTAARLLRTNARRHAREQEAFMQSTLNETDSAEAWQQLAPHLETAMGKLNAADRALLVLRFYENKTGAEAAVLLGIREDAAHKRAARAVEKLRKFFAKRGVSISGAAIAGAVSANSIQAAPVGLAAIISANVFSGTTITTAAIIAATKTIAMTTLQKITVTAALTAAIGAGIYQAKQAHDARAEVQTLQQQQAPLAEQIQRLQKQFSDSTNQLVGLLAENSQLKSGKDKTELLKLRGENTVLNQKTRTQSGKMENFRNLIDQSFANDKEEATNAAIVRIESLQKKLGLSESQAQKAKEILMGNVEAFNQIAMSEMTGAQTRDAAQSQSKQLYAEQEQQLVALLDPAQQDAYQQLQQDEKAKRVERFANSETEGMKSYLGLTSDQATAVASILASLPVGEGGYFAASDSNAKDQLEIRIQALSQILTPAQINLYRQQRLMGIQKAQQMTQAFQSIIK